MARPFGVDDDAWEAVSYDGEQLTSHGGSRPQVKTMTEQAFATNWDPSTAEMDNIANHTGPTSSRQVGVPFHNRRAGDGGGDAEPRQLSEQHSDFNTTAPLNPIAVQDDIQFTASWFESNKFESTADSGFFSAPSNVSSIHQALDPSLTYSTSSLDPYHAAESSLDYSEQILAEQAFDVSSSVAPWHYGARLDQDGAFGPLDYFLDPTLYNAADNYTPLNATEFFEPSHIVGKSLKSPSITDSQPARTVSSKQQSSIRSHTRHTDKASQGGVVTCDYCDAKFTGRYNKGNCSRHVRQQHSRKSAQQTSDCVCSMCNKLFARQDARRKHEWKKHGLQGTKPCRRRQGDTHDDDTSHAGTYETCSEQGTLTLPRRLLGMPAIPIHYSVPLHPQRVHDHFTAVKAQSGDDAYDDYCRVLLEDSRALVDALQEEQSAVHYIFDRALRGLAAQLRPEQLKHQASPSITEGYLVDADTETNGNTSRAGKKQGKSSVSRRTSDASSRIHPYSRPNKKTSSDPLVALLNSFKKPESSDLLDCPVHKWYLLHADQGPSACNGCAKDHMNSVRQHLLPSYSQQHVRQVSFIKRCTQCKEDIVCADVWQEGGHAAKTCPSVPQPRDIEVLVWARLYLKIFPQEVCVPSPYVNDERFLPGDLVAQIRRSLHLTAPMSSHFPQQQAVQHLALPNHTTRRYGFEDRDNSAPPHLSDHELDIAAVLDDNVALDIMIERTARLLISLTAERQVRASRGPASIDGVEADHAARRQAQQQKMYQTTSPYTADHMSMTMLPPQILVQAPIIGGADFQLPNMQPDIMSDVVHVPDSHMGTQPSTHDTFQDEASYRRQSQLNSSLTDYDNGPHSTFMDQSQSTETQFYAPMEPSTCPPATYFPNGQWMYDPRLDVPGSSSLPQTIAEEYFGNDQLAAEVDQSMMETSPSHSPNDQRMPASQAPADYEEDTFDAVFDWYSQQ